ncbi:MAG TPA: hypothetical protein VFT22_07485 [Kofleriaceae bacterium]|nr:hypothetical protein [Kofleriaceae bacterium]
MTLCTCQPAALCATCFGRELMAKLGQARVAGAVWAERVALRHPELRGRETWPADDRALELARRKVETLAQDPRLREELARACVEGAAAWWRGRPGRYRSG